MASEDDTLKPPAYLDEEVPLPDEEWMPAEMSGPPEGPPPNDDWMPAESAGPRDDIPPPDDAPAPRAAARPPSGPPTGDGERAFGRGETVKIVSGKEGVGTVGEIFWWGESKFGEGMRAGVRGDGDQSFFVDEEHLGWPDDDIPDEILEAAANQPDMGKGDRVRVIGGRDSGAEGVIFWWGESKWGDGMRAGLKTDDDETIWADASELERVDGEPADDDDDIPY